MNVDASRWTVIGAGPCGIASVGRLLDYGIQVTWIDPKFLEGRMGEHYRNVPSNTLNGDLITGLTLSPSLQFSELDSMRRKRGTTFMSDLDHNCCYELGIFVDTLSDIREALLTKTTVLKNEVIEIRYDTDGNGWKVCTGNASHNAWHETDVVLYCGGSRPLVLPTLNLPEEMRLQAMVNINNIIFHNLDYMVDPQYCKELVLQNLQHSAAVPRDSSHNSTNSPNQSSDVKLQNMKWVVVGNSHSAMLVMMNLYEAGVRNIVNFYRSDLRFMHDTTEGWRRYQGIGLKGPVGEWAKSTYLNNAHINPVRISNGDSIMQLLQEHGAAQCVVAIGYERNMGSLKVQVGDYVLSEQDFTLYDRISGEIPLLPCSCCSPHIIPAVIKASDPCGLDSDATTTVCKKCGQKGRGVPKGRLFGGGIAFPQDLVDGGGNREPWVGFKRSVEQVDLMVDVFCKVNGYCYS